MPWYDKLFASHAKKGFKKGVHKNGPRPYYKNSVPRRDPNDDRPYQLRKEDKYAGGRGGKKRRNLVQRGVRTKNQFVDTRANRANPPVYLIITHWARPNPLSNDFKEIAPPERKVISKEAADKQCSPENKKKLEAFGNYVTVAVDVNHPDTRKIMQIMDGDRLEIEKYEFRTADDPEIYDF